MRAGRPSRRRWLRGLCRGLAAPPRWAVRPVWSLVSSCPTGSHHPGFFIGRFRVAKRGQGPMRRRFFQPWLHQIFHEPQQVMARPATVPGGRAAQGHGHRMAAVTGAAVVPQLHSVLSWGRCRGPRGSSFTYFSVSLVSMCHS